MATRKKVIPIAEVKSYASCRSFFGNKEDSFGYCRRFPPIPFLVDGSEWTFMQPVVDGAEYCEEYSRKLDS